MPHRGGTDADFIRITRNTRRRSNSESNISTATEEEEIMADETATAIQSLTKQLHALSVKLDTFRGTESENVEDFIKDFKTYLTATGLTEEEDIKASSEISPQRHRKRMVEIARSNQNHRRIIDIFTRKIQINHAYPAFNQN